MEIIDLKPGDNVIDFKQARRQAAGKAGELMKEPVIITWKDETNGMAAPEIPGASQQRWQDYAENFGGKLEVNIGDQFHFVFSEAENFDTPDINVATLTEQDGTRILCTEGACTEQERQALGYFAGGGTGG